MTPDPTDFSWLRLIFAFSVVLALMAGLGFALKYISTRGLGWVAKPAKERRIRIVESMAIDPKRRFVIVNCDGHEHLLLLSGQGDIVVEANLPLPNKMNAP